MHRKEPKLRIGQKVRIRISENPKRIWTVEKIEDGHSGPVYFLSLEGRLYDIPYKEDELEPVIKEEVERQGLSAQEPTIEGIAVFRGDAVFPAQMDNSGRIVVPQAWRKVLGLKGGDMLQVAISKVKEKKGKSDLYS